MYVSACLKDLRLLLCLNKCGRVRVCVIPTGESVLKRKSVRVDLCVCVYVYAYITAATGKVYTLETLE